MAAAPPPDRSAPPPVPAPIWARPERSTRGPKPTHTRDEITAAAIAIADAEGIDAVSMRRVAGELQVAATSLYRYVAKKDELFELMVDAAAGELPHATTTGDWVADLRALAEREREQLKRHPWLLRLPTGRTGLGPQNLRNLEHGLSIVDGLGLDIDDMVIVLSTVLALVHGFVMSELADQEATRRSGLDQEAWMETMLPYGSTIIEANEYPLVVRVMLEAEGPHAPDQDDRTFRLGLDRVLSGIQASIEGAPPLRGDGAPS
ncbi:TetR/AcrR family transcriptional regulator [Aquihabitans sp. McL0605]|uniref:TetR/AcrR family transcriptional regulator n=1 Tax=Aquihabitans sp. McL0605 TaxID=3415671 RepID=UPI003CFA47B7